MIKEYKGNIFDVKDAVICITVNCVGIAGKGLALECAKKYPEWEKDYKKLCSERKINIGSVYIHDTYSTVLCSFPTKHHWKNESKYYWVLSGLGDLYNQVSWNIRVKKTVPARIAIPKLGCNNGKLDWNVVKPLILERAKEYGHIETIIVEDE